MINILEHGAVPDGKTNCTKAIQAAIDVTHANRGGTVLVPAGSFITGSLWMRSRVTLHLDAGATLLGSQDVSDFPEWTPKWEGPKANTRAALIGGEDLDDIAITGRGTIDGRGEMWWKMLKEIETSARIIRPRLIRLVNCRNVLIEGVTVTRSPSWTINPVACENVTVTKVTVKNPANSPNTDGINPDSCRNVHISDCHIDVGDDCITIKSGSEEEPRLEYKPCENITITNCTMIHGHGGVVIGSEMTGGVKNVAISNCTFVGTDRGIRMKARRGRGGTTGAAIEDVRVSNIVMDGVLCPLAINLFYGCGAWGESKVTDKNPQPVTNATPRFRRLRFSNISARRAKYSAAWVMGLPEMWVEDIAFNDVSVYLDPTNTEAGDSDMAPDIDKLCRAGFFLKNVSNVQVNNVQVFDQVGPAVTVQNGRDVTFAGVKSDTRQEDVPLIALKDVNGAYVHGCSSPEGSTTTLSVSGAKTRDVVVGANRARRANQVVSVADDVPSDAVESSAMESSV